MFFGQTAIEVYDNCSRILDSYVKYYTQFLSMLKILTIDGILIGTY